jgi:large subunit ribosomal protein L20
MAFATRDRKVRKRDFRRLWITRIDAACKANGMGYNRFVAGLKKARVALDRKILAHLALEDEAAFRQLVEIARNAQAA